MFCAKKPIFEPSNYMEKRNFFWKKCQFLVRWRHVTSLLNIWQFFGFLATFRVKIGTLIYNFSTQTEDMLKSIILASWKSKNNWKTSSGFLWDLIFPKHVFSSFFTKMSVRSKEKWWFQHKIMNIFKNGFVCQLILS